MDFGGLKAFKEWSEYMFDHTLIVAHDDPMLEFFEHMNEIVDVESENHLSKMPHERGALCDLRVVEGVGCELFSKLAYETMENILRAFQAGNSWFLVSQDGDTVKEFKCRYPVGQGVRLHSAEVFEHSGNSAIYEG
jgi:6-pyruvoyltetrahydropterin/6-carboxytetrahydropterin synthase